MLKVNLIVIMLVSCCATLLAIDAVAEELYRWREADGTITFSKTPPPSNSGIAFEKISATGGATQPAKKLSAGAAVPASDPALLTRPARSIASDSKTGHCNELRKRVQSLERLITTDVSNETMDNAVVQMARYQTSFNQSCQGIAQR